MHPWPSKMSAMQMQIRVQQGVCHADADSCAARCLFVMKLFTGLDVWGTTSERAPLFVGQFHGCNCRTGSIGASAQAKVEVVATDLVPQNDDLFLSVIGSCCLLWFKVPGTRECI